MNLRRTLAADAQVFIQGTLDATEDADAVVVPAEDSGHRSGGAGHHRFERRFRGKYRGDFTDREWTEWLLAFIAAEEPQLAAEDDLRPPRLPPPPLHTKPVPVEPEPLPPLAAYHDGLIELEAHILTLLAEAANAKKQKALAKLIAKAKLQQEEEELMIILLAA